MEFPSFGSIDSQDISNISHYTYKNLDAYLNMSKNDPRYSHVRANIIGEMYEYLIYEKLIKWVTEVEEVSEFVIKGPYIKRNNAIKERFVYDANSQIFYMSGGETIGEFDALFRYGKHRYFVEITQTENKPLIKALEYEILRKYNLIQILFPRDEIGCWVITSYQGQISAKEVSDLKILRTPKYNLDPDSLGVNNEIPGPVSLQVNKFKSVYQLEYQPFHLFKTLFQIHNQLRNVRPGEIKKKTRSLVKPYIGLIERIYVGKISNNEFNNFLKNRHYPLSTDLPVKDVYLALRISKDLLIKKTIFLRTMNKRYYELTDMESMKLKKINRKKRSRREISRLDRSLKKLNSEELEQYYSML